MNPLIYLVIVVVLLLVISQNSLKAKTKNALRISKKDKEKRRKEMKELIERYVGKLCYVAVNNIANKATILEVTDTAILVVNEKGIESIINLDYVSSVSLVKDKTSPTTTL